MSVAAKEPEPLEQQLSALEAFSRRLEYIDRSRVAAQFTELYREGYRLLGLDLEGAARIFDTSLPCVERWISGRGVPSAAVLIIRFLDEEIRAKILELREKTAGHVP